MMEKADFLAGVADEIEYGCSAIRDYFDRMPLSWLAGAAGVGVSSASQLKHLYKHQWYRKIAKHT